MDETVARLRAESAAMRARLRTEAGRAAFDEIAGGDTDDWTLFDLLTAVENEAATLDSDRLRHALVAADEEMGNRYPETFPLDLTNTGWPRFAEAIARQYAALRSQP